MKLWFVNRVGNFLKQLHTNMTEHLLAVVKDPISFLAPLRTSLLAPVDREHRQRLDFLGYRTIGEVAKGNSAPFWFQLYIVKDRGFVSDMIALAKQAGCGALLLTVDLAVPGTRYRDYRAGMSGSMRGSASRMRQVLGRPDWAWDVGLRGRPLTLGNIEPMVGSGAALGDLMGWVGANFDASVTWKDVEWVREQWKGPLVIKGILDPDDAREALANGADGIVVSNHGGRQLDGVMSSARRKQSTFSTGVSCN